MKHNKLSTIIIAYGSFIALGLFGGALGVAWPSIRDSFSLTNDAFGSLLLASAAGYVAASFGNGWLIKRLGLAFLFIAGTFLMAAGILGQTLAGNWLLLLSMMFVMGAGSGWVDAGMNTYASTHFRPRLLNWLHASFGLGTTFGTLLLTAVLTAAYSWQTGLLLVAVLHGVMLLIFALTWSQWKVTNPTNQSNTSPSNRAILQLRIVWISVTVFFLYAGVEIGVGHWAYTLLTESRGVSQVNAGIWASVYWSSFTIGRLLLGFIETNLVPLIRWGLFGVVVGLTLLWLNPFTAASVIALGVIGFATAPIFPALIALTPIRIGEANAPTVIGFQMSAAGLSIAVIPGFSGILADRFSLETIPLFMLFISLLLVGLHEWLIQESKNSPAA